MQLSDILDQETRDALRKFKAASKPKPRFLRQMASAGVQLVEIYQAKDSDDWLIQAASRAHFLPEEQTMISNALDNGAELENGTLKLYYQGV